MNGFKRPVEDKATFSTHQAGSRAFAVFGCDPETDTVRITSNKLKI